MEERKAVNMKIEVTGMPLSLAARTYAASIRKNCNPGEVTVDDLADVKGIYLPIGVIGMSTTGVPDGIQPADVQLWSDEGPKPFMVQVSTEPILVATAVKINGQPHQVVFTDHASGRVWVVPQG